MVFVIFCHKKDFKFIKRLAKNCGWSVRKLVVEAVKYFYKNAITNKIDR